MSGTCKMSSSVVAIILVVSVTHLVERSTAAKLEFNAGKHDVIRAGSVGITCSLDGQDSDNEEIVLLQISGPGDNLLVSWRDGQHFSNIDKLSSRFKATGSSDGATLTLAIIEPQPTDLGEYTCGVSYINTGGKLVTHSSKGTLTEDDISSIMSRQLDALAGKVSSLESTVKELSRKTGLTSVFSVATFKLLEATVGQKIVFPNLVMSHGLAGYDTSTGIYTVPVDGIYVFHLTLGLNCRRCVMIGYLKANQNTLGGFGVHDENYYDQSSISVSASLKKGDQVYVVPSSVENGAKLTDYRFSSFNGFLLEPL